jgi:hypothetical protein
MASLRPDKEDWEKNYLAFASSQIEIVSIEMKLGVEEPFYNVCHGI